MEEDTHGGAQFSYSLWQERTVRYVTRDPIQNLRIKATLIRLSAARPTKTKLHKPADQDAGGKAQGGVQRGARTVHVREPAS